MMIKVGLVEAGEEPSSCVVPTVIKATAVQFTTSSERVNWSREAKRETVYRNNEVDLDHNETQL